MKYKILIDRKSIRKNPNAGRSVYHIPGVATITIKCLIKNGKSMCNLGHEMSTEMKDAYAISTREVFEQKELNKLFDKKGQINKKYWSKFGIVECERERPIDTMHTIEPEPDYIFKYKSTKVKCKYCKKSFSYWDLKEDANDDYYSETICPKCNRRDCCEIEYEDINEVMKLNKE